MLSRVYDLLFKRRVDPSVEDVLEEQRVELESLRREIAAVKKQLADGGKSLEELKRKETKLAADIECVQMEIHDPMLLRIEDQKIMGAETSLEWEHCPCQLLDAATTLKRISTISERTSAPSSDSEAEEGLSNNNQVSQTARKKHRGFAVLEEEDVPNESDSDKSTTELNPDRAVVEIGPRIPRVCLPPAPPEPPKTHTVVTYCLRELTEADFTCHKEWLRWQLRIARMQQENLVRDHFRKKVLGELTQKCDELEGKLFSRRCDLIHFEALEENAERQLRDSGILQRQNNRRHQDAVCSDAVPVVGPMMVTAVAEQAVQSATHHD